MDIISLKTEGTEGVEEQEKDSSTQWENKHHIESIKKLSDRGFNVIIDIDVTYVAEAILPLLNNK
ncbi:S-adenosyl-L-methionine-dependent methyltransferase superfamily protein, putative [Medicago truncatula]|uniref:S-adenosyl-L-methionine-dependent methyltransferase superfamily protein, putative n=1 Tax=Medicago truncatula TaxID=3880 RepID=G7IX95_MEDTR|nr:S-adenosyl-L-methionine-dependent methyltransferase superfamily protein, putative [Medicago truncatula]